MAGSIDLSKLVSDYNSRQGASEEPATDDPDAVKKDKEEESTEPAGGDDNIKKNEYENYAKWSGIAEFNELLDECTKVAPFIKKTKTEDAFVARQYIFAINDGCGFTAHLRRMADQLKSLGLFHCSDERIGEITLADTGGDSQDEAKELYRLEMFLDKISRKRLICGVDISEWLPYVKNRSFTAMLKLIEQHCGEQIFVFRVPYLEKEALDNIKYIIGDLFTVRTVAFTPYSTNELLIAASDMLQSKSFSMNEDTHPVITTRLSEEKRDGRFYNINTVEKIVREMIYSKLLTNAEEKRSSVDTHIASKDIKTLAENFDINEKPGLEQLNDLIGLETLKKRVMEVIGQIEISKKANNIKPPCIHMRFTGNPGTGKTTVARIVGKILQEKDILRNGLFFEYGGRDLIGRYVGETAPKTAAICRDAYGSVLFIDEAYSLYTGDDMTRDYGKEALTVLISQMEDHRDDMLVIMAGYTDDMATLMKGNAGLASRVPFVIEFPNYTREELAEIYFRMASVKFTFNDEFKDAVRNFFSELPDTFLKSKEFSNARFVRNLFERTWGKAATRMQLSAEHLSADEKIVLTTEDFMQASAENEFKHMVEKKMAKIGF